MSSAATALAERCATPAMMATASSSNSQPWASTSSTASEDVADTTGTYPVHSDGCTSS